MDTQTVDLSTLSVDLMDTPQTADSSIFKAPADVHCFSLARKACTASSSLLASSVEIARGARNVPGEPATSCGKRRLSHGTVLPVRRS
jgi:hypothetical protein